MLINTVIGGSAYVEAKRSSASLVLFGSSSNIVVSSLQLVLSFMGDLRLAGVLFHNVL